MRAPRALDPEGHSVRRFIERCFPPGTEISFVQAEQRLQAIRCFAEHVEDIPDEGQEIWRGYEEGSVAEVLMVVRDGVVRTVLPPGSRRPASRR